MFEFTLAYTRPDGSAPVVGDADDARLFQFSAREDFNDHRHALSVGALLFDRGDFRAAAGKFTQDALWLFGGEGFEKYQRLQSSVTPAISKYFPDGGYYVMQNGQAHLFVDAGDIGMHGRGGHGHNDTLSFELWVHGQPLVVDSGTYCYSSDVQARQEFRGTSAHNTVVVDGREIAEFDSLWSVKEDRSDPRLLEWTSTPDRDILEVEHFGYRRLSSPVVHRRRFEFRKEINDLSFNRDDFFICLQSE